MLADAPGGSPELILIASGSELAGRECPREAGDGGNPLARGLDAVVGDLDHQTQEYRGQCAATKRDRASRLSSVHV